MGPQQFSRGSLDTTVKENYASLGLSVSTLYAINLYAQICKLEGEVLRLLGSYLECRFQYMVYNGDESGRWVVMCGVSQGSVLGPLFFLIYVNDMVRASVELGFVLFADNTNLFAEGGDPVELFGKVNRGLGELGQWLRCNGLTLNLKKTEYS
jgi:hypothetical protein